MTGNDCIACGYPVTHPYYHTDPHPLSVMVLPRSAKEARSIERFPMKFNMCARCGHVFNTAFSYASVPYEANNNLMYNKGSGWRVYLRELLEGLGHEGGWKGKTFLEIGCGDGDFMQEMQDTYGAKGIGFEPGIAQKVAADRGLTVFKEYFVPERDLPKFRPDMVVARHVIEHLEDPLRFVTSIAHFSQLHGLSPLVLVEVPRIDKAIEQTRINDYLYEHVSNFTDASFRMMFERAGFTILEHRVAYGEEVLVGLMRPEPRPSLAVHQRTAAEEACVRFPEQAKLLHDALVRLSEKGSVAFWGGTGKSASFLNALDVDAERFPIVVDSDPKKSGYFVPGMGQEIRPPEWLKQHPVDFIVITTQWRAKDIYEEIARLGIPHRSCHVVSNQELVTYRGESI